MCDKNVCWNLDISLEISKELDQQNRMLDNVNTDLEEAIGGLDVVTKKTKDLIKKSGEGGRRCVGAHS